MCWGAGDSGRGEEGSWSAGGGGKSSGEGRGDPVEGSPCWFNHINTLRSTYSTETRTQKKHPFSRHSLSVLNTVTNQHFILPSTPCVAYSFTLSAEPSLLALSYYQMCRQHLKHHASCRRIQLGTDFWRVLLRVNTCSAWPLYHFHLCVLLLLICSRGSRPTITG